MSTVLNEHGGAQSHIAVRFDLIPPDSIRALAGVFAFGVQVKGYKPNNWRWVTREDHINHAIEHLYAYLHGDTKDEDCRGEGAVMHLSHALCRVAMARSDQVVGQPDFDGRRWMDARGTEKTPWSQDLAVEAVTHGGVVPAPSETEKEGKH